MNNRKVIFKEYTMKQPQLLPPSLEELIPGDHLARVINRVIELIEIRPLLEKHKGGGTSSYHPRMLLKVIVYAHNGVFFPLLTIYENWQPNDCQFFYFFTYFNCPQLPF